ncbi:MAG: hypothetical protein M3336_11010, partial [Chloroflexota bacterium]|nr:hypothetical protein [Chloroflexota bacterium]
MIANVAQFWRLTRELDVNALRESFEQPVSVRVLGSDLAIAERIARLIDPDPWARDVSISLLQAPGRERADLYIVAIGGPLEPEARRVLSDLTVGELPLMLVQVGAAADMLVLGLPDERVLTLPPHIPDDQAREQLFGMLVRSAPHVGLPLGRRHALVREAVAEHLI